MVIIGKWENRVKIYSRKATNQRPLRILPILCLRLFPECAIMGL